MNRIISAAVLSMVLLSAVKASATDCNDTAIQAIESASNGLSSSSNNPTIATAKAIVAIAQSCNSSEVRVKAAEVLRKGMSSNYEPAESVAKSMRNLCRTDAKCAKAAIETLSDGLYSSSNSPTIKVSEVLVEIAKKSGNTEARVLAAKTLKKALSSNNYEPSTSVAENMETLCGSDADCAEEAVTAMADAIDSSTNDPTISVAWSIVEIVKQAPAENVKQAAIASLSKGLDSSNYEPAQSVGKAIAEVGKCN